MVPEKKLILMVLLFLVTAVTWILDLTQIYNSEPWSLIILQVKFDNNCLSGFRIKSCLKLFKYAIFRYSNITLVNRK